MISESTVFTINNYESFLIQGDVLVRGEILHPKGASAGVGRNASICQRGFDEEDDIIFLANIDEIDALIVELNNVRNFLVEDA